MSEKTKTILGVAEAAELTGLEPGTITKYRQRGIFPPPDHVTARQDLWERKTIEKWMTEREAS